MLTKGYQRSYIPAVPGSAAIPYRAPYTVCQAQPAPGQWVYTCTRMELPDHGAVLIPPGGQVVYVYDPSGAHDPLTGQPIVIDVYIQVCTSTWKVTGKPGPPICTTYPAQLYVPAVPAKPARVDVTPIQAWDAGANSVTSLDGDCVCTFTMGRVAGVVVGLTQDLGNVPDYARMSHALYFHGPHFNVMEYGATKSSAFEYAAGDEFKIQRANGEVTYTHNGRRVYTSRAESTGAVNVGSALYASGDYIE